MADDSSSIDVLNSTAQGRLKTLVERIERLEEDKAAISGDLKEVYLEAKGEGFDVKILRKVIRLRKQDTRQAAGRGSPARPLPLGDRGLMKRTRPDARDQAKRAALNALRRARRAAGPDRRQAERMGRRISGFGRGAHQDLRPRLRRPGEGRARPEPFDASARQAQGDHGQGQGRRQGCGRAKLRSAQAVQPQARPRRRPTGGLRT